MRAMLLMFLPWRDVFLDKERFFGAESGASRSDLSSMVKDLPWCPTAEKDSFYSEKTQSKDLPWSTRICEPGYGSSFTYLFRPVCNIVTHLMCAKFTGNTAQSRYFQAIKSLERHPREYKGDADVCFTYPSDCDFNVKSSPGKMHLIKNHASFRKSGRDVPRSKMHFWRSELPCIFLNCHSNSSPVDECRTFESATLVSAVDQHTESPSFEPVLGCGSLSNVQFSHPLEYHGQRTEVREALESRAVVFPREVFQINEKVCQICIICSDENGYSCVSPESFEPSTPSLRECPQVEEYCTESSLDIGNMHAKRNPETGICECSFGVSKTPGRSPDSLDTCAPEELLPDGASKSPRRILLASFEVGARLIRITPCLRASGHRSLKTISPGDRHTCGKLDIQRLSVSGIFQEIPKLPRPADHGHRHIDVPRAEEAVNMTEDFPFFMTSCYDVFPWSGQFFAKREALPWQKYRGLECENVTELQIEKSKSEILGNLRDLFL